jgi:hypothetical protein
MPDRRQYGGIANRIQCVRQMQAEVDGRGQAETARMPRVLRNTPHECDPRQPPFLEPALLRAGFNMSGDALVWFAIWNAGRNLGIAIDALF